MPSVFSINNLIAPAQMLYSLMATVFAIQGLSFTTFLFNIKVRSKFGCVILAIIAYGLLPVVVIFIGVFEQVARIRDKIQMHRV